jgi:metal-responsive CopG/Arc/MetJ family transcriptional regulator
MKSRTAKRGALTKDDSKAVLIYFPKDLIPLIDRAVQLTDSDRSKFIRASVRDRLHRLRVA